MSADSAYVTTRRPRALGQGESELKPAPWANWWEQRCQVLDRIGFGGPGQ